MVLVQQHASVLHLYYNCAWTSLLKCPFVIIISLLLWFFSYLYKAWNKWIQVILLTEVPCGLLLGHHSLPSKYKKRKQNLILTSYLILKVNAAALHCLIYLKQYKSNAGLVQSHSIFIDLHATASQPRTRSKHNIRLELTHRTELRLTRIIVCLYSSHTEQYLMVQTVKNTMF